MKELHELQGVSGVAGVELAVDDTVVTLPAALVAADKARFVELSVKAAAVRYTLDGTDPASDGAGSILGTGIHVWKREKAKQARFIESAAGSDGVIRAEALA